MLSESMRDEIRDQINNQMSVSMLSEGMHGGWQMEHVHGSNKEEVALGMLIDGSAPDKDGPRPDIGLANENVNQVNNYLLPGEEHKNKQVV